MLISEITMHSVVVLLLIASGGCVKSATETNGLINAMMHASRTLLSKTNILRSIQSSCANAINDVLWKDHKFVQYLDALGKPGSGLYQGNSYLLGDYDQCNNIPNAHYCTMLNVKINITQIMPVMFGVCIPSNCSAKDVTEIFSGLSKIPLNHYFTVYNNSNASKLFGKDVFCFKQQHNIRENVGAIIMLSVSLFILCLCIIGTSMDLIAYHKRPGIDARNDNTNITMRPLYAHQPGNLMKKILLCFSLLKNMRALFNTEIPDGVISCVNGIRTISTAWMILGQLAVISLSFVENRVSVLSWKERKSSQLLLNAHLSADTFYLLSGTLVAYLTLKRFNDQEFQLFRFYVYRYVRLTPLYAFVLFFRLYLYPLLSRGPYWYTQFSGGEVENEACQRYWWTNLLYINNFYPLHGKMCLNWSWYLAFDMQFYVISPIMLWGFHKLRSRVHVSIAIAFISIAVAMLINGASDPNMKYFDPLINEASAMFANYKSETYLNVVKDYWFARVGPYIVGLLLGYTLHRGRLHDTEYTFNLTKLLGFLCGWTLACILMLSVIYGSFNNSEWNTAVIYLYGIMFRLVWSFSVAWMIYACHNGFGGPINNLLSGKAFIPLSRLTYSVYLIHAMVIYTYFGSSRIAFYQTEISFALQFAGTTSLSFVVAIVLVVCVEYPVARLYNMLPKCF